MAQLLKIIDFYGNKKKVNKVWNGYKSWKKRRSEMVFLDNWNWCVKSDQSKQLKGEKNFTLNGSVPIF
jgi:hypothetical protein